MLYTLPPFGSGCFRTALGSWSSSPLCVVHSCSSYSAPVFAPQLFFNASYSWGTVNISTLGLLQIVLQWTLLHIFRRVHVYISKWNDWVIKQAWAGLQWAPLKHGPATHIPVARGPTSLLLRRVHCSHPDGRLVVSHLVLICIFLDECGGPPFQMAVGHFSNFCVWSASLAHVSNGWFAFFLDSQEFCLHSECSPWLYYEDLVLCCVFCFSPLSSLFCWLFCFFPNPQIVKLKLIK